MSATYFSSIVHLVSIMFESNLFKYLTTSNIVIGGGLKSRSIFFILMTSNIRKLQKLKTTLSDLLYRVFFLCVCRLVPGSNTSDETENSSLETRLLSISNKC